jgi:hypothetical protein
MRQDVPWCQSLDLVHHGLKTSHLYLISEAQQANLRVGPLVDRN